MMPPEDGQPHETVAVHNRLLKVALAVEESRLFWAETQPELKPAEENRRAFEERWFGGKSAAWVAVLMANFRARYAAFPAALEVLRKWRPSDPATRRLVCHWHLQLADPYYRRFAGEYLPARQSDPAPIDFAGVLRWVHDTNPKTWQPSTCRQVAGRLLSATAEAGLLSPAPDPRRALLPQVSDEALGYVLHLLRETSIARPILDNEYLGSVGLSGVFLEQRLRVVPWVTVQRVGDVVTGEWRYRSLQEWAEAEL